MLEFTIVKVLEQGGAMKIISLLGALAVLVLMTTPAFSQPSLKACTCMPEIAMESLLRNVAANARIAASHKAALARDRWGHTQELITMIPIFLTSARAIRVRLPGPVR